MAGASIKKQFKAFLQRKNEMDPFDLPIFPINAVLFPGGKLSLKIFESRYMDMVKACLKDDTPFGIALIKEGSEIGSASPEKIGCMARIVDWDMPELGILNVKALGLQRFFLLDTWVLESGLRMGKVTRVSVEPPHEMAAKHESCRVILEQIITKLGEENFHMPFIYDDAVWVSYRLAEVLPLKLIVKQQMLEMNDPAARIEILHNFLSQQGLTK